MPLLNILCIFLILLRSTIRIATRAAPVGISVAENWHQLGTIICEKKMVYSCKRFICMESTIFMENVWRSKYNTRPDGHATYSLPLTTYAGAARRGLNRPVEGEHAGLNVEQVWPPANALSVVDFQPSAVMIKLGTLLKDNNGLGFWSPDKYTPRLGLRRRLRTPSSIRWSLRVEHLRRERPAALERVLEAARLRGMVREARAGSGGAGRSATEDSRTSHQKKRINMLS